MTPARSRRRRAVRRRLSRLPLRLRLVAGFSVATFVVLLAAGAFVYWRIDSALSGGLDAELGEATTTLAPLIGPGGRMTDRSQAEATGVAWQVLAADGTVLDRGGPASGRELISVRQLARAAEQPRTYDIGDFLPASPAPFRLMVTRAATAPDRYLVVGVRRDKRDEALRELLVQLTVAGVATLLVTAFVGERLARAALRPVERYRRRAAAIAAGRADLRLDVPVERDDEITRLGHTFNEMLSSLEEALERERQFVGDASHELRTPVTLLTSRVQLALRRPRTATEHEHILEELLVDLDRLSRLADQLLDVARAGTAGGPATSDLVAAAARLVADRRLAVPEHAGDLRVDLPADAVEVAVADLEVERILVNTVDNAFLHGRPPVDLAVDAPAPGWARVVVTDAGEGMPPALLATATQRFARAEEARARPGSGLGLSLVAALVDAAGGELRLCHRGTHEPHGVAAPVPCDHGAAMTVTVLLPTPATAFTIPSS